MFFFRVWTKKMCSQQELCELCQAAFTPEECRHLTPLMRDMRCSPHSDIKKFPESLRLSHFWHPQPNHEGTGWETPLKMFHIKSKLKLPPPTEGNSPKMWHWSMTWLSSRLFNLSFTKLDSFWNWRFLRPRSLSLFISWIHTPWFLPRRDFRAPERIIKG